MEMFVKKLLSFTVGVCVFGMAGAATAGPVLIINGQAGTSEPGTTSSITEQLQTLHQAVGNVVTISNAIPDDLSAWTQVWDIRFSNAFALTASDITQYTGYLAGGGGMFVMGENSGFMSRNNSVLSLISAAGGGDLSFVTPSASQTVLSPFTGPNAVTSVGYAAPGGVSSAGTGDWISVDGSGRGTGVAWGVGDLANASAGALTTIFDVNFMMLDAGQDSQNLTRNLIGFIGEQVDPTPTPGIPEPATWAMMIAGFGMIGVTLRRRRLVAA